MNNIWLLLEVGRIFFTHKTIAVDVLNPAGLFVVAFAFILFLVISL